MPLVSGTHHASYLGKMRPGDWVWLKIFGIKPLDGLFDFGSQQIEDKSHLPPRKKIDLLSHRNDGCRSQKFRHTRRLLVITLPFERLAASWYPNKFSATVDLVLFPYEPRIPRRGRRFLIYPSLDHWN